MQPSKTRPCLTERLLMGRKESNQTNKNKSNTLDPDTVVFNLILISSSLFLTYRLLFPLTILLLFFFFSTNIAGQRATV